MSRLGTIASVSRIVSYPDGFGVYGADVKYRYDLDRVISCGFDDAQEAADAMLAEAFPHMHVEYSPPDFGCTAFSLPDTGCGSMMGRNYDFKLDTSSMLVRTSPRGGRRSVAFAALDNISVKDPLSSFKARAASSLLSPFICLDGMNDRGVSIAVLTLDSTPTDQRTGRARIFTTLAIRLVLDRATSAKDAVELLSQYDMMAMGGRDYHFYITDAGGEGTVVEYDPDSATRDFTATPADAVTNFFAMRSDMVKPFQKNGIYGHGMERRDAVRRTVEGKEHTTEVAWEALKASSQEPNPEDVTSNTQWSIVYNNSDLTAEMVLRRHWGDRIILDLRTGKAVLRPTEGS